MVQFPMTLSDLAKLSRDFFMTAEILVRRLKHFISYVQSINQSIFILLKFARTMTIIVQSTPWAGQQGSQWH